MIGFVLHSFLAQIWTQRFDCIPSIIVFKIKNAFAVKGQDSSPLYQSTWKKDNYKAFVRVWVLPDFLLGANFDQTFWPYASYHHFRIKDAFSVKGQDRSPLYQSPGKRDNFKGFRTCLVAVFWFALTSFLAQIWTHRFGRMPSTIIFESRTLLP